MTRRAPASSICLTLAVTALWPLSAARAQSEAADAIGFGESEPAPSESGDALGFGDAAVSATPAPSEATEAESSAWVLTGSLRAQGGLRLEQSGADRLATLRQTALARVEFQQPLGAAVELALIASLRTEADFRYLMRRDHYDDAIYETYAWQVLPGEGLLRLQGGSFELAIGNQIVNYGQGEMLSVLDLVNPRDLREPILSDPSELRMPRLMTRLQYSAPPLRFEVVAIHESYFGLVPPPLGEFSPFRKLLEEQPGLIDGLNGRAVRIRHAPARGLDPEVTQVHGRVVFSPDYLDLVLQAATLLEPLGLPSLPSPVEFEQREIDFPLHHPRYTLLGHAGTWTIETFLVRWELALELDKPISLLDQASEVLEFSAERANVLSGMLGVTWVPSTHTNAAIEVQRSLPLEKPWESRRGRLEPLYPIEAPQFAARFTQRFMRERGRLDLLFLLIGVDPLNAWSARLEVAYTFADGLELSVGAVTYQPSDHFGVFYGYEENDRAFCSLRWNFSS